jgi:hypothetical protein
MKDSTLSPQNNNWQQAKTRIHHQNQSSDDHVSTERIIDNVSNGSNAIKKMSGMFFVVAMTEKTSYQGRIPVCLFFSGCVHPCQNFFT